MIIWWHTPSSNEGVVWSLIPHPLNTIYWTIFRQQFKCPHLKKLCPSIWSAISRPHWSYKTLVYIIISPVTLKYYHTLCTTEYVSINDFTRIDSLLYTIASICIDLMYLPYPQIFSFQFSVTGEFPAQGPVTRSFGVFFDLRLYKRLSKSVFFDLRLY